MPQGNRIVHSICSSSPVPAVIMGGENRRVYLPGEGLDLGPDEVEPVLHLLQGGEQLRRVISAKQQNPCEF
jgi:hypothetical protein